MSLVDYIVKHSREWCPPCGFPPTQKILDEKETKAPQRPIWETVGKEKK